MAAVFIATPEEVQEDLIRALRIDNLDIVLIGIQAAIFPVAKQLIGVITTTTDQDIVTTAGAQKVATSESG